MTDNKEDSEYFDDILDSVLSRRRNNKVSGIQPHKSSYYTELHDLQERPYLADTHLLYEWIILQCTEDF